MKQIDFREMESSNTIRIGLDTLPYVMEIPSGLYFFRDKIPNPFNRVMLGLLVGWRFYANAEALQEGRDD